MDLEFHLKTSNFDKQYQKLSKKLKNKKIIIYGAGQLFQTINEKYDLSKFNIIAISDAKFTNDDINDKFLNYKKIPMYQIEQLNPDYVFVATLNYLNVVKSLEDILPKKIKIFPLVQKPLFKLLKEIWSEHDLKSAKQK